MLGERNAGREGPRRIFLYQDVTVLRGCRLLSVHTRRVQRKAEARLLNIQMHPQVLLQPVSRHKRHYTVPYPSVAEDHQFLRDLDR